MLVIFYYGLSLISSKRMSLSFKYDITTFSDQNIEEAKRFFLSHVLTEHTTLLREKLSNLSLINKLDASITTPIDLYTYQGKLSKNPKDTSVIHQYVHNLKTDGLQNSKQTIQEWFNSLSKKKQRKHTNILFNKKYKEKIERFINNNFQEFINNDDSFTEIFSNKKGRAGRNEAITRKKLLIHYTEQITKTKLTSTTKKRKEPRCFQNKNFVILINCLITGAIGLIASFFYTLSKKNYVYSFKSVLILVMTCILFVTITFTGNHIIYYYEYKHKLERIKNESYEHYIIKQQQTNYTKIKTKSDLSNFNIRPETNNMQEEEDCYHSIAAITATQELIKWGNPITITFYPIVTLYNNVYQTNNIT